MDHGPSVVSVTVQVYEVVARATALCVLNLWFQTKPFSLGREVGLKRSPAITGPDQQRGAIMAIILNAIYREFVRSSLSGMRKFAAG